MNVELLKFIMGCEDRIYHPIFFGAKLPVFIYVLTCLPPLHGSNGSSQGYFSGYGFRGGFLKQPISHRNNDTDAK
jgi:hypothetical protein